MPTLNTVHLRRYSHWMSRDYNLSFKNGFLIISITSVYPPTQDASHTWVGLVVGDSLLQKKFHVILVVTVASWVGGNSNPYLGREWSSYLIPQASPWLAVVAVRGSEIGILKHLAHFDCEETPNRKHSVPVFFVFQYVSILSASEFLKDRICWNNWHCHCKNWQRTKIGPSIFD